MSRRRPRDALAMEISCESCRYVPQRRQVRHDRRPVDQILASEGGPAALVNGETAFSTLHLIRGGASI